MPKREISNIDLKIKLLNDYVRKGHIKNVTLLPLLQDLTKIKNGADGKVDTDTITPVVNCFLMGLVEMQKEPPHFQPDIISEYASLLQKESSFEQETIDTIKKFNEIYDEYKEKKETLFRGQIEAKWRLYSRLQRLWITGKLHETESSYQDLIEKMVDAGKTDYSLQIKSILEAHHIDSLNPISVLGFLQHHGCPTPLLDWTFKFQNAVYFAIDGLRYNFKGSEIEDYCSVYFIEEKHFGDGNFRNVMEESIDVNEKAMLHEMFEFLAQGNKVKLQELQEKFGHRQLFDRDKLIETGFISHMTNIENLMHFPIGYFSDKNISSKILFSLHNSKNILNQDGAFTWNANPYKPVELLAQEQFADADANSQYSFKFCKCFNIHKSLKHHIRDILKKDGITKEFIYPTTDVNAFDIFEKCKTK